MTPRGLGWIPSPEKRPNQTRDYSASVALKTGPIPESASCRDLIIDILDQGSLPTCVSNATVQAIRATLRAQGELETRIGSRLWLHYMSGLIEGDLSGGRYYRDLFASIQKLGLCSESYCPYETGGKVWAKKPSKNAFRMAHDLIGDDSFVYHRIYDTGQAKLDTIKRAIAQRKPVLFGCPVTEDFCNNIGTREIIPRPKITDPIAGGHAMLFDEYDGASFGVVNSWGNHWGIEGYCRFSPEYVAAVSELWIIDVAQPLEE